MSFVWFWTFWHWSKESFRAGALLDGPVHGMAGHWDEWYRHEASDAERCAIDEAGHSPESQRRFVAWLARRWAADAMWRGEHPPARFVLAQLAGLAPFDGWIAFARYRAGYHVPGIAAVVIGEESAGTRDDVRKVEAICVPADRGLVPAITGEGFHAEQAELAAARDAADRLLGGRGLALLLWLWILAGRRPYPRAVVVLLGAGWVAIAATIGWLLAGPDPGARLPALGATLLVSWMVLVAIAVATASTGSAQAWRVGRQLQQHLARSQVRLRMSDGLTLVGGSAGLAFSLNVLLAITRALPRMRSRSWLWSRVAQSLRTNAASAAATGVVTADGRIHPVVLAPKLRAALAHTGIAHLLTPWQREAKQRAVRPMAESLDAAGPSRPRTGGASHAHDGARFGFAVARHTLASHRCRHLAQAVLTLAGLWSGWQLAANVLAVAVSATMLLALPDLRALLLPPPAPIVVAPTSSSPYHLWVSLDTPHPRDFSVVLESPFWVNRRVPVARSGGDAVPARAEIPLTRRRTRIPQDIEDGTVFIERRQAFLFRDFAPGERVGSYSLSYVGSLE